MKVLTCIPVLVIAAPLNWLQRFQARLESIQTHISGETNFSGTLIWVMEPVLMDTG
jgi:hypothetical protein